MATCSTVMCLACDEEKLSGVCGSPTNSLEVFALSREEVCKAVNLKASTISPSYVVILYRVCLRKDTVWS